MRGRCPSRTPYARALPLAHPDYEVLHFHSRPFASAPRYRMERVAGIEPAPSAWKAEVLPLNYTRRLDGARLVAPWPWARVRPRGSKTPRSNPVPKQTLGPRERAVVEGVGFEPTKAEPSDLQSGPFGHSGTPPGIQHKRREIVRLRRPRVNDINVATPPPKRLCHPKAACANGTGNNLLRRPDRTASRGALLVPPQGIEPWTFSLQVSCSTD